MKKVLIIATAMAVSSALFVAQGAGDAQKGAALYTKTCKACHGEKGEGNPAMMKKAAGAMHDLKAPEVQKLSDAELTKKIVGGYGTKKAIKKLTDAEMADVIAFVRSLAKK